MSEIKVSVDVIGTKGTLYKARRTVEEVPIGYFHGYLDDELALQKLISDADVIVVPSTSDQSEGVPEVIEEAPPDSVPVIATQDMRHYEEFKNDEVFS